MAKEEFDPRARKDLDASLSEVDRIVMKKYVSNLDKYPVYQQNFDVTFNVPEEETVNSVCLVGSNIMLLKLCRVVFDKDENVLDKMTTALNATALYELATLIMLIKSDGVKADIYYGTVCKKSDDSFVPQKQIEVLKNNLVANFPGTELSEISNVEERIKIVQSIFKEKQCVASVTGIAALKDENTTENTKYIQGIEKLIDSVRDKKCTVLVIADPVESDAIEKIRSGFEEIHTALNPFQKSEFTLNKTNGKTVTDSVIKGVTDTTTDSLAKTKTHTTTKGTNSSHTVGGSVGVNASATVGVTASVAPFGIGASANASTTIGTSVSTDYHYMHGKHEDKSDSEGETSTTGSSKSLSEQNSIANALSENSGEGLQISYLNRSVQSILERIDMQIDRISECEDFGMYDCGAYFLSDEYATCLSAASTYKSLIQGEKSSVETSHVNIWDTDDAFPLIPYLATFNHPVFDVTENKGRMVGATASTLVSGRELSIYMSLPKHSVSGIPVIECASFGRNVLENTDKKGEEVNQDKIEIGCIHHMHTDEEGTRVELDKKSLSSHVFITGSTGAGKSNTVYQLINRICKKTNKQEPEETKFMVVEPAKGEYKDVFGGRDGVHVYGTNPMLGEVLRINPFSFPEEIHILEHIDRLVEIFNVCWPMYAAMPAVLKEAIERSYEVAGWNLDNSVCKYKVSDKSLFPTFVDVLYQINQVIEDTKYSSDSKGDYVGALTMRVGSLTNGLNGQIFTSDELKSIELFDENVIVDLSRVGATETKSLIMGMLIIKLQEYRMSQRTMELNNGKSVNDRKLRHVTVLEEAHNILKRTSTEQSSEGSNMIGKSVEMLANAISEMRTYGEGFIIADQSPGLMDMSVIRNTNTKIILRLPDMSDRELVGKAANLNEDQIVELAKLRTGVAAVYQNNWTEPVLCHVDEWDDKNNKGPTRKHSEIIDLMALKKTIIGIIMNTVPSANIEQVDDLRIKIRDARLESSLKIKLLRLLEEKDVDSVKSLRKDVMYGLFSPDHLIERNLCYRNDIKEWCNAMQESLVPDINSFEKDDVNKILATLANEKRIRDGREVYQELFVNLMTYIDKGRRM
jgi:DNA helicase HerA-like ATPase